MGLVDYAYQGQWTAVRGYHTTVPVTAEYAYDHLGRVTDIAAGTGVDFHYDYVANENNIWKKRFDHRNGSPYNAYSYDDIDRLAGVTYLNSETEGFVMDDLGNRTGIQTLRGGGTDDYSLDSLTNRYTAIDASPLGYDAAGNLTQDKDGYVYGYDYENRIVEIRSSADALIAQMDYDTQGRRVRVHDAAAGTETLCYYSDQWQVLAEYTPSGTQQAYYVYGNYIDEVLFWHVIPAQAGIQDFYYLHDHLYSVVALLNPAGTVIERYEYDAYGKASILSSDFSPLSSSGCGNHILFTGREVDSLDNGSLSLQCNRNRYLSQYMGRWYSHDPLGYVDGINLYQFVKSNCTGSLDPLGLVGVPIPLEGGELSPMDWAIVKIDWMINDNSGYNYASITGINHLLSNLRDILKEIGHSYLDDEGALGRYKNKMMYLPVDASEGDVFHESIHAYLHLKKGLDLVSANREHEGIAYAAERMYSKLAMFRSIEEELKNDVPNVLSLKAKWQNAWRLIAGVKAEHLSAVYKTTVLEDNVAIEGSLAKYRGFIKSYDFKITSGDISNVESYLGFKIKCNALATKYTEDIQAKLGSCYKFKCEPSIWNSEIAPAFPLKDKVFE